MDGIGIELLIILILTLANGFFAAAEISIVSAKRGRLQAQADAGSVAARTALELSENPDRFLATVQVGISLVGTFSAAFGGARIADILAVELRRIPALTTSAEGIALFIVVLGLTYLSLVVGELVPKRLALRRAERMLVIAAPIMKTIALIARPVIVLLTFSVAGVVRLFGRDDDAGNLVTTDDILYMAREGEESGSVESGGAQMIERVLRIADRPIRSIMTPRTDIQSIPLTLTLPEVVNAIRETGVTRLPVYDTDSDNIVGILNTKDLVTALLDSTSFSVRAVIRPAVFLVEGLSVSEALARFRADATHIAMVVGEYGEISGLLTLEDVLEELVGEIRDEHDTEDHNGIVHNDDGSWWVSGLEPYITVAERVGLPDDAPDTVRPYNTIAGMIMHRLNHIPHTGDQVVEGDFTLEVLSMDARRIDRVCIRRTVTAGDAGAPTPEKALLS
ncbi:MAG: hemolysin family protein [Chloroflexota bacterium]|nr:hemolysin family protein [Chloroflexota bacterium]